MLTPEILNGRDVAMPTIAHTSDDTIHAARILGDWLIYVPPTVASRPGVQLARRHLDLGGETDPDVWRVSRDVAERVIAAMADSDDAALAALALQISQ